VTAEIIRLADVRAARVRTEHTLSPYAGMTHAEKEREVRRLIHEIALDMGFEVTRPGGANR
jgi:hypothetical protein